MQSVTTNYTIKMEYITTLDVVMEVVRIRFLVRLMLVSTTVYLISSCMITEGQSSRLWKPRSSFYTRHVLRLFHIMEIMVDERK